MAGTAARAAANGSVCVPEAYASRLAPAKVDLAVTPPGCVNQRTVRWFRGLAMPLKICHG